jgi:hypothetical protein
MYATGGTHPVRRWARNLAGYCPQLNVDITELQHDLCRLNPDGFIGSWEYQLFYLWIEQNKITQEQVEKVIISILEEVLFDLSQDDGLTHQIKEYPPISKPLALIDEKQVIADVQQFSGQSPDNQASKAIRRTHPSKSLSSSNNTTRWGKYSARFSCQNEGGCRTSNSLTSTLY